MQSFEATGKFGQDFVDTSLKSFASVSKGAQAIAVEAGEYTRKSFETGAAAVEKVLAANSLEDALEIQTGYAKQAYEGFVAQASKLSELYADLAKEAYKPFESIVATSR
jgi:phasin family protein